MTRRPGFEEDRAEWPTTFPELRACRDAGAVKAWLDGINWDTSHHPSACLCPRCTDERAAIAAENEDGA